MSFVRLAWVESKWVRRLAKTGAWTIWKSSSWNTESDHCYWFCLEAVLLKEQSGLPEEITGSFHRLISIYTYKPHSAVVLLRITQCFHSNSVVAQCLFTATFWTNVEIATLWIQDGFWPKHGWHRQVFVSDETPVSQKLKFVCKNRHF